MPYKPLEIDRQNLTVMGVSFSSVPDFESTVNAIGTVMYEGFEPTPKSIEIIRDYTDKNTGGLRNLAGISDPKDLLFFESAAVYLRKRERKAAGV